MRTLERGIDEAIWAPPQAVTLRVAARADARSIAALWHDVREGSPRRSHLQFADVLEAVYRRMAEPEAQFLLAFDGEWLVGMIHFAIATRGIGPRRVRSSRLRLSMLAVDPTYWRRGVRRDLLSWCLGYARSNRIDSVKLWTHAGHAPKLFERLGFRCDHRWKLDLEGDLCARYRYEGGR